jgi:predicted GNAT family N-acyltransferase
MTAITEYKNQTNIELIQLNWADAQALAMPIRRSVFIEEQQVPESKEWDDEDSSALHIIVIKKGETVATARLTQKGKIGRMSVLKAHRNQGIGSMMLVELINAAKQRGLQDIKLWSQTHAQAFYKKHAFIACGNEFLDAGIPHIEMRFRSI